MSSPTFLVVFFPALLLSVLVLHDVPLSSACSCNSDTLLVNTPGITVPLSNWTNPSSFTQSEYTTTLRWVSHDRNYDNNKNNDDNINNDAHSHSHTHIDLVQKHTVQVDATFLNHTSPFEQVRAMWGISGQDGGYSMVWANGTKGVLLFGDTPTDNCGWLHQTALMIEVDPTSPDLMTSAWYLTQTNSSIDASGHDRTLTHGNNDVVGGASGSDDISHTAGCLFPNESSTAFWPAGGYVDEISNMSYVFVTNTSGNGVGVLQSPLPPTTTSDSSWNFTTLVEISPSIPDIYSIVQNHNNASDPFLYAYYVYGNRDGRAIRLLRFLGAGADNIGKPDTWEYWTGQDFTGDEKDAANVTSYFLMNPQLSCVWNEYLGAYALLTSVFGNQVKLQLASTPWGPFSEPTTIYDDTSIWPKNANYAAYWLPTLSFGTSGQSMPFVFSNGVGGLDATPWVVRVDFGGADEGGM
eukprot:TRINITY_DN13307_c0_g1_i1.p1 TRINITY_DN13307_c0_g1~~TRINITY_DN13307_c0_g1_i1.p1  ORF type:complete len:480 (+),score=70.22 TRINITY_DN13307_c0_g1_i1:44-1441(+)